MPGVGADLDRRRLQDFRLPGLPQKRGSSATLITGIQFIFKESVSRDLLPILFLDSNPSGPRKIEKQAKIISN